MKMNQFRILFLVMFLLLTGAIGYSQQLGDVNNDTTVDIVDALLIAQNYVGLIPAVFNLEMADVNCSGSTDIVDALLIAQYYVSLIQQFPCSGPTSTPDIGPVVQCVENTPAPVPGSFEVLNPGSSATLYTSEHFVARWNPSDNVPLSASQVQNGLNGLERVWEFYMNEIGFQEPYYDSPVKYKVNVNVSDQGWATGAGTGRRDPGMWVHYNAFQDLPTLSHEFAHTLQFSTMGMRDSDYVGWSWESHAEWMRHQYFSDQVNCAEMLVNAPHLYYGSTRDRYCNWQFWEYLKDTYCYKVVNDIWAKAPELGEPGYRQADPFSVLMKNMGWTQDQLNDNFGYWAMKNVVWDYSNGDVYYQRFGSYDNRSGERRNRVTQLEELDLNLRRFVVPEYWAPQRWGYNVVKLIPDNPGTDTRISLTFKGVVQNSPAYSNYGTYAKEPSSIINPGSGWRWGLVAKDSSGDVRYSPLQSSSNDSISFDVQSNDREVWLVVVGAPGNMHQIFWDQIYYTIYRYPWMIELDGAWPEGFHPSYNNPSGPGARHPNGGGWVASTASVDASAYVGPHAQVLGSAQVRGKARIEDWALVSGYAQVRDNAIVKDHASVSSGQVYEDAVVGALTIVSNRNTRIHGSAYVAAVMNALPGVDLGGTVKLIGDIELVPSLSRGVYYGIVDNAIASDPAYGANRTSAMPEVTRSGPFTW